MSDDSVSAKAPEEDQEPIESPPGQAKLGIVRKQSKRYSGHVIDPDVPGSKNSGLKRKLSKRMSGHIVSVPIDHEDIKTSLDAPDSSNKKIQSEDQEFANSNKNDLEGNRI